MIEGLDNSRLPKARHFTAFFVQENCPSKEAKNHTGRIWRIIHNYYICYLYLCIKTLEMFEMRNLVTNKNKIDFW